jgi:hypothetical protein
MNRWSALALLLAVAVALALRVPKLDTRPFHNDEAVNAIKVTELWQHGRYAYDPNEYHGPTLHYATLPFLWLSGARNADELKDATLRLTPLVFFGVRCGLNTPASAIPWRPHRSFTRMGCTVHRCFSRHGFLQPVFHSRNALGLFHGADARSGMALRANACRLPLSSAGRGQG